MRKALKYTSIAVAASILLVAAAIFFVWHSITSDRVRTLLDKQLSSAKSKGVTISVDKIRIEKQFPNLFISVKNLSVRSKGIELLAYNPHINVNIIKLALAKITGKDYFGKIGVDRVYVKVTKLEKRSGNKGFSFPQLPYIPVDLYIPNIRIETTQFAINGWINLTANLLTKSNSVDFKGTINKIPVDLKLKIKRYKIAFEAKTTNIKAFGASLKNIRVDGSLEKNLSFSVNSKISALSFKSIFLSNISTEIIGKIDTDLIKIEKLSSKSKNGFLLTLNGNLNTKNPLKSTLSGSISTPFIDVSQFFYLLPKDVKPYLGSGEISLRDVEFSGQPSLDFVKNGSILIKSVKFRINPDDPFFELNRGKINITKDKIVAVASGYFDKIRARNSSFVLYRKEGFKSDLHLNLYGTATELVRLFIEENILSESDLKLLGKSKNLKGNIKARIDVLTYRFKPKPYFDFSVKLYPKGIEFENPNIPNHWVKASGYVGINRLTKNGRVTSLYILFKNFTAQTMESQFKASKLKLTIKPTLGLYGQIDAKISRKELNALEYAIANETDKLRLSWVKVNGSINGAVDNFKFSTDLTIPITFKGIALNTNVSGTFSNGILEIKKLIAQGIGNLLLSGVINVKQKKIINLKARANNLKISDIKSLLPIPVSGTLSGEVDFSISQKPYIKKANLTIKNGSVYDICDLNADIKSDGNAVRISNASFNFLNNHLVATGEYDLNTNSINVSLFTHKFTLDTDKVFKKSNKLQNKNVTIHLPNQNMKIELNTIDFILKHKEKTKDLKATAMRLTNDLRSTIVRIESPFSHWSAIIDKQKKTIKILINDRAVWPFLTDCSNKKNKMDLHANLRYKKNNIVSLKDLSGSINFTAKDGCIPNAPASIKLLTLLNPFSMFLKGIDLSKGIQYDKIQAHLKLNKNIIKTKENDAAIVKGKSIDIFAYGKYYLLKSKIDAYVTFITFSTVNKIVSHIPIVGWILTGKNKSFTGLSFHIYGNTNSPKIKPVPLKSLAKGVLGVVKRTIMLPLSIFGVK